MSIAVNEGDGQAEVCFGITQLDPGAVITGSTVTTFPTGGKAACHQS